MPWDAQTSDKVRGLEQYVSGTVGERAFELEDDQAVAIDAQTLLGDGSSGHVTTYAFEFGPCSKASLSDGAVERETIAGGGEGLRSAGARLGDQQGML